MTTPPDTLNQIGVLKRREIEARILAPLVDALAAEFGRERVLALVRQTVLALARRQGAELAAQMNARSLPAFNSALAAWKKDEAMTLRPLAGGPERLDFDVTRCRYAEMYQALGIPELGALLSCNRDAALIEGYNPEIRLTRTQTIMQGAPYCDFRYTHAAPASPDR